MLCNQLRLSTLSVENYTSGDYLNIENPVNVSHNRIAPIGMPVYTSPLIHFIYYKVPPRFTKPFKVDYQY